MTQATDLIEENKSLKARLALAETWMRREVTASIDHIRRSRVKKGTRGYFKNVFETDGVDMITQSIMDQFGDVIDNTPKYTLERLIDAEILWHTLQQYPTMDALPIVLAYQKILDTWIEETLISPWRTTCTLTHTLGTHGLELDMSRVVHKGYALSFGRLYELIICQYEKSYKSNTPYIQNFLQYLSQNQNNILDVLTHEKTLDEFKSIIKLQVFSSKRHTAKVSYSDARNVRSILLGKDGLLHRIFALSR